MPLAELMPLARLASLIAYIRLLIAIGNVASPR
jgi:hypothetical protein